MVVTVAALDHSQAYWAAAAAIAGSLIGSLFLFFVARKGGEAYLHRHTFSPARSQTARLVSGIRAAHGLRAGLRPGNPSTGENFHPIGRRAGSEPRDLRDRPGRVANPALFIPSLARNAPGQGHLAVPAPPHVGIHRNSRRPLRDPVSSCPVPKKKCGTVTPVPLFSETGTANGIH